MQDGKYASDEVLVGPQWLQDHLHDPTLRVVEVDVSSTAYNTGHIGGAVLWNIYGDLKDSNYRLVDKAAVQDLVRTSGIAPDSTVVFYGYAPAMGFWLMKLYGHSRLRILDTSRTSWEQDGRPWTVQAPVPAVTDYLLPDQDGRIRAGQQAVQDAVGLPAVILMDVRTDAEFRGERFWPSGLAEPEGRAGHIPSAMHLAVDGLLTPDGAFRSAEEVRRLFAPVKDSAGEVITYCTVGARACTAWFALSYLMGRGHVRVYDGSWAEWGKMPATPVEAG
ncbi:sulfurtransferase [Arthrobacter sp. PAMC25564]|uniref:sulfurtransferase n=1 Tax=Arthrobacter sp. PAMC25564 TaxID=2565366 RepID=UPI0010A28603|nr:sulfurtransferase [Arthrobacter sp. PAMC25564]QCB97506.1 sulfurtransferase [Arthrobacter sp. PAMC25564]